MRPAKHIERMLVLDGLRRLRSISPLPTYTYVGFGALYFVDFNLAHRALGITNMTSLERDKAFALRCEFNKPFDSVDVLAQDSTTHFANAQFAGPTIAWPDYTDQLTSGILGDIDTLCLRLPAGSVVLVTVCAAVDQVPKAPHGRLAKLEQRVGEAAVPLGTTDADLDGWDKAGVLREIINDRIEASVVARADGTQYQQLFNIRYRDGARMLTIGGVLWDNTMTDQMAACGWADLESYRPGLDALTVEVPELTLKEMAALDAQLPNGTATAASPGLPQNDVNAYKAYYRYYPKYALVDV
jgi:hypothetical protein